MKDIDDLLELAKDYADMRGRDLFNVALITSIEDYKKYKMERDEKERVLNSLRDQYFNLALLNTSIHEVHEPLMTCTKKLSLEDIIDYAENLDSNDDVKTIQIMLYKLFAKECSADELDMIGNMRPMKRAEVTNVFHDNAQYVKTIKKQVNKYGRNNNV